MSERRKIQITVPDDCQPGDRIDIVYAQERSVPETEALAYRFNLLDSQRKTMRRRFQVTLYVWVILEVCVVILLTLTIALNVGATLSISRGCEVLDPLTFIPRDTVYLNIFYGLSGNEAYCKNTGDNWCVPWSSENWFFFENLSGYPPSNGDNSLASRYLFSAQILICLTLGFTVIACVLHGLVLTQKFVAEYSLFLGASYLLLIAFALSIASLSNIVTASPFSSTNWTQYFRSGATLLNLLTGTRPAADAALADPKSCVGSVELKGGAMLSASVAALFVLMVWSLFSGCLAGPMVFTKSAGMKASSTSTAARPASDENEGYARAISI